MAEGVPVDPPLKAHFPFLSLWAWDPPATPTLSLPFSSGSAGTSRLPPLLILGCFSELITLSTLLPLKNSANYKNPVALDICGRADNGSCVWNGSLTRFSDVLVHGGRWADKRASLPTSLSSPYPLFWSSFLSSSFPFSVCVSHFFLCQPTPMPVLVNSHCFRQKAKKPSLAFQKKHRSVPMTMSWQIPFGELLGRNAKMSRACGLPRRLTSWLGRLPGTLMAGGWWAPEQMWVWDCPGRPSQNSPLPARGTASSWLPHAWHCPPLSPDASGGSWSVCCCRFAKEKSSRMRNISSRIYQHFSPTFIGF